jgi:hypothetical protein
MAVARATGFCFAHDPALEAKRDAARRKGGLIRIKPAAVLPPQTPDLPLATPGDLLRWLAETGNAVRRGELDPRAGNTLTYICATGLRVLEVAATLPQPGVSEIQKATEVLRRAFQSPEAQELLCRLSALACESGYDTAADRVERRVREYAALFREAEAAALARLREALASVPGSEPVLARLGELLPAGDRDLPADPIEEYSAAFESLARREREAHEARSAADRSADGAAVGEAAAAPPASERERAPDPLTARFERAAETLAQRLDGATPPTDPPPRTTPPPEPPPLPPTRPIPTRPPWAGMPDPYLERSGGRVNPVWP